MEKCIHNQFLFLSTLIEFEITKNILKPFPTSLYISLAHTHSYYTHILPTMHLRHSAHSVKQPE